MDICLTLQDLPAPPPGKIGWPWTKQSDSLAERMPDGAEWPRISIVTPSYNQGNFLEETIRSVLLQGYPNLEYIIIDGGSNDNSVDIIQKYQPFLTYWVSEADQGQSNAINKGIQRCTGSLLGWQNSDDYYAPNAFKTVAKLALEFPNTEVFYGSLKSVDAESNVIGRCHTSEFNFLKMMPWANMFNQSMFFRDQLYRKGHLIDESFHHYMDLDLFWRLALAGYGFHFDPKISAYFRLHPDAKGFTQYEIAAREAISIYQRIYQCPNLSLEVRAKALNCIRSQSIDCFDKSEMALFQETFKDLIAISGVSGLNLSIIVKYLLSLLGSNNVQTIKSLKRLLISSESGTA